VLLDLGGQEKMTRKKTTPKLSEKPTAGEPHKKQVSRKEEKIGPRYHLDKKLKRGIWSLKKDFRSGHGKLPYGENKGGQDPSRAATNARNPINITDCVGTGVLPPHLQIIARVVGENQPRGGKKDGGGKE